MIGSRLVMIFVVAAACVGPAKAAVDGTVVDETSAPLRWVKVQMAGFEEMDKGRWVRILRSGGMRETVTDEMGRFSVPTTATRRYDLTFDRYGFGPKFMTAVEHGTSLTVMLDEGVSITGTVTRREADGTTRPLENAPVTLRLPRPDFWYQHTVQTDEDGRYKFRASVVPDSKSRWQVVFLDEVVQVDVVSNAPVTGPDFEVTITKR